MKFISLLLIVVLLMSPNIAVAENDSSVNEFNAECLNGSSSVDFESNLKVGEEWTQIQDRSLYSDLNAFLQEIEKLSRDGMLSEVISYRKKVDGEFIFLSKYKFKGQFGTTSVLCMITDFSAADWTFPNDLMSVLDEKITKTQFSENIKDQEYSIGLWRTTKIAKPITRISVNAYSQKTKDQIEMVVPGLQMAATIILD